MSSDGAFREVTREVGPAFQIKHAGRGVAFGDYDNDGNIDILINTNDGPPVLIRNPGTAGQPLGRPLAWSARAPTAMLSARMCASRAGALHLRRDMNNGGSYLSSSDPRLHFGLGERRAASTAWRWTGRPACASTLALSPSTPSICCAKARRSPRYGPMNTNAKSLSLFSWSSFLFRLRASRRPQRRHAPQPHAPCAASAGCFAMSPQPAGLHFALGHGGKIAPHHPAKRWARLRHGRFRWRWLAGSAAARSR